MEAVETRGPCEAEGDPQARRVVFDDIADGPVPTIGSDAQRTIQTHGGPLPARPQLIVRRRQRVEQLPDLDHRGLQLALMEVDNLHGDRPRRDVGATSAHAACSSALRAAAGIVDCVFHAIADTHFTGSRTAFHVKADTVSR